jgi:hypothetical protein
MQGSSESVHPGLFRARKAKDAAFALLHFSNRSRFEKCRRIPMPGGTSELIGVSLIDIRAALVQ